MSKMSDLMIDIMEDLATGSFTFEQIASRHSIPLSWVTEAATMMDGFDNYDDSLDGDHASALASAGWGTDEDYIMENDYDDSF